MREIILTSAIWFKDLSNDENVRRPKNVSEGVVLCGYRHNDIISQLNVLTGERLATVGNYTQGFITNLNRFVDREDACIIARASNQILVDSCNKTKLYSEDLY